MFSVCVIVLVFSLPKCLLSPEHNFTHNQSSIINQIIINMTLPLNGSFSRFHFSGAQFLRERQKDGFSQYLFSYLSQGIRINQTLIIGINHIYHGNQWS